MKLRKLFQLQPRAKKAYDYTDILHLWEDDYLMIELLPKENAECFDNENFIGTGFRDISMFGEKFVKTIDRKISTDQVDTLFRNTGLQRVNKVFKQGIGPLEGDKVPLGFGSCNIAVILESKSSLLENIWLTGGTATETEKQQLIQGFREFARQFGFIGVDWFASRHYDLNNQKQLEAFIKNSC